MTSHTRSCTVPYMITLTELQATRPRGGDKHIHGVETLASGLFETDIKGVRHVCVADDYWFLALCTQEPIPVGEGTSADISAIVKYLPALCVGLQPIDVQKLLHLLPESDSIYITNTVCDVCGGKVNVDCVYCTNTGVVECDMGHEHDCEGCDGRGAFTCSDCVGGVVTPGRIELAPLLPVRIDRNCVNARFLRALLPLLGPGVSYAADNERNTHVFASDYGYLFVMGMRRSDSGSDTELSVITYQDMTP